MRLRSFLYAQAARHQAQRAAAEEVQRRLQMRREQRRQEEEAGPSPSVGGVGWLQPHRAPQKPVQLQGLAQKVEVQHMSAELALQATIAAVAAEQEAEAQRVKHSIEATRNGFGSATALIQTLASKVQAEATVLELGVQEAQWIKVGSEKKQEAVVAQNARIGALLVLSQVRIPQLFFCFYWCVRLSPANPCSAVYAIVRVS